MTNSTVSGNTASSSSSYSSYGGGIYNDGYSFFYNTIIAQNNAETETDLYNDSFGESGFLNAYNTLSSFTDWTESDGCLVYDPLLPLFHVGNGFCFLAENSQAINKGNNGYISGYETDVTGNPRIVRGTVDLGAYEYREGVHYETPSTTVTTSLDIADPYDGKISLREAIYYAASGDTITFDSSLAGQTITLSCIELKIDKGITIDASSIGGMTIDADGKSRVFNVTGGTDDEPVELIGLTITGGRTYGDGGGIYNSGTLTLTNSTVSGNTASSSYYSYYYSYGGGIYNGGTLTLTNSTVSGNTASSSYYYSYGGGIFNGGTLTLTNSTVTGNTASSSSYYYSSSYGGGISNNWGISYFYNTIIAQNNAKEGTDLYYNVDESGSLYAYNTLSTFSDWTESDACLVYDSSLPLFADASNGDYTLAKNSQAIDRGNNAYVETETDLAGNPRIVGGVVDLGAYEYQPELPVFSVSLTDWSGVYDGSGHSVIVSDTYAATDTIRYSTDGKLYQLTENPKYINVGAYTTYVKISRNGYRDWCGSAEVKISPAFIDDVTLDGWTGVFDGAEHTISVIDPCAATDTIRYSTDGTTYELARLPEYKEIGVYTIYVKVSRNNYVDWYGSAVVKIEASVVTTLDDVVDSEDGFVSLREALGYAADGDTISFSPSLSGGTIRLNGTQLEIAAAVTIDASDIGGITIDGNGKSRVFKISGGTDDAPVELIGLTITGGAASSENGGGIYHSGALKMTNCTVADCSASSGGGIYNNSSTLTMIGCAVAGNSAAVRGGGIFNYGNRGSLAMFGCTVSGNGAGNRGGGICKSGGELTFYNSVIALNTARVDADLNNLNTTGSLNAYNTLSSFTDWTESDDCLVYDPSLPLFADASNGDYTLAKDSQAIDRGNNAYVETETDLAGNPRIDGAVVDLGAYEYQGSESKRLGAPTFMTGNKGAYVSYGANRHQMVWDAVENASGYELQYSADGSRWTAVPAAGTATVVTGLPYGQDVKYRVRALGTGSYTNSEWSGTVVFGVCPMDINGDGDITGADRTIMMTAWFSEEGDDDYRYYADINADGDISGSDLVFLSNNWLSEAGEDGLVYPRPLAADAVFAAYESGDPDLDPDVF